MIVCSCNIISRDEIEQVIEELLTDDPWQLIVPLQVYHTLHRRGRCCGCFPNVSAIIVDVTRSVHSQLQTPECVVVSLLESLQAKHQLQEEARVNLKLGTGASRAA